MRRALLPLALGSALALAACGDDTTSSPSCGPGTVEQNGQCVAAPTDTSSPTDTGGTVQDTYTPPQDTGGTTQDSGGTTQDTYTPPDTASADTVDPNVCDPAEAGTVRLGGACTKDCQCDQSEGGDGTNFCYHGIYMQGFRFCTRDSRGNLATSLYQTVTIQPACFGIEPSHPEANKKLFLPDCTDLAFCKGLASQYTHCGTQNNFPWASGDGTSCVDLQSNNCSTKVVNSRRVCLIATLSPFQDSTDRSAQQCGR